MHAGPYPAQGDLAKELAAESNGGWQGSAMLVIRRALGNGSSSAVVPSSGDLPDRAWKLFDVVNSRIEHADVKATAILGGCGVVAAALIALITGQGDRDLLLLSFAAASGIFVLASAAFCCAVLWPRRLREKLPESLIYFDHLARASDLSGICEQLRLLLQDTDALSTEVVKQVLATSRVASRKYDLMGRAMLCFFGTLVGLSATALIFAAHRNGHWL